MEHQEHHQELEGKHNETRQWVEGKHNEVRQWVEGQQAKYDTVWQQWTKEQQEQQAKYDTVRQQWTKEQYNILAAWQQWTKEHVTQEQQKLRIQLDMLQREQTLADSNRQFRETIATIATTDTRTVLISRALSKIMCCWLLISRAVENASHWGQTVIVHQMRRCSAAATRVVLCCLVASGLVLILGGWIVRSGGQAVPVFEGRAAFLPTSPWSIAPFPIGFPMCGNTLHILVAAPISLVPPSLSFPICENTPEDRDSVPMTLALTSMTPSVFPIPSHHVQVCFCISPI